MDLLNEFKKFLFSQANPPSKVTVKNYLSDVNNFVKWFVLTSKENFSPEAITKTTIDNYKTEMEKTLSPVSLQRHLSSLRKFFFFLVLENKISKDPFKPLATPKDENDPWKLKDFKNYLYVYNASHLTIKNYIIDVKQFLNWAEEVTGLQAHAGANVFEAINSELLEEYKKRLVQNGQFSASTVNRKLSSLRKYIAWGLEENLISPFELGIGNFQQEKLTPKFIEEKEFSQLPKIEMPIPAIQYSKFPPLRLFQKVTKGIDLFVEANLISNIARTIETSSHLAWKVKGQPIFDKARKIRLPRYIDKIDIFGVRNIKKEFYAPLELSMANLPRYKQLWLKIRYQRPKWYKTYHSYAFAHYLNFVVLIIFVAGLTLGFYNGFVKATHPTLAANPNLPTNPLRILSFQGRLTDNSSNPITTPTNLRFAIYRDAAGTGAAVLLWQEVDQVSPDQDGIFNTLLGNTSSVCASPTGTILGKCAIYSSLFSENNALWLGVTVESTGELTPRQPIATVAYAVNSETLQGLPPITATASGVTNVVLALDSTGNLTIGSGATSASPIFSVNGNLTLSSNTLKVLGTLGTVPVSSISGRTSIASLIVNNDGVGDIFTASASGWARFTITNTGAIGLGPNGTNIGTSAQCLIGGSIPSWGTCGSGGGASWWNQLSGVVYPTSTLYDFALGWNGAGSATTSALFTFLHTNASFSNQPSISIWDSTSHNNGLTLTSSATDATIDSNTGTINIGHGGGTLFIQTDIQNDSANNSGAIQITDRLNVLPAATSNNVNASLIVNNPGTGDIFTASQGGTQKFTITNSGGIRLGTSEGSNLNCLLSGGAGVAASWGTCDPNGFGWWNQVGGVVYPTSSLYDFAVGGTSTASATFSVTGNQLSFPLASMAGRLTVADNLKRLSPTPIATISGNTGSVILSINNNGFGDLLTASNGGNTKFTVDRNGFIGIGRQIIPGNTSDITLRNGDTIANTAAGTITISPSTLTASSLTTFTTNLGTFTTNSTLGVSATLVNIGNGSAASLATTGNQNLSLSAGSGTLNLNTVSNGAVTTGTGAITLNGNTTVSTTKTLTLTDINGNNQILYGAPTTGIVTGVGTTSTPNQCLLSGATIPSWGTCPAGVNWWDQVGGVVYPTSSLYDFAVGGTSTASATFSVTGNQLTFPLASLAGRLTVADNLKRLSPTPIATISGNTGSVVLSLNNNGRGDLLTASTGGNTKFTVDTNGFIGLGGRRIIPGNTSDITLQNGDTFANTAAGTTALSSTTFNLGGGSAATITTTTNGLTLDSGSNTLTFAASDTTLTTSLQTFNTAATLGISATTLTLGNGSAATITTTTNGLTLDSGSNTLTFAASDTTLTTSLQTFTTSATLGMTSTTTLNLGNNATLSSNATALNLEEDGGVDINIGGTSAGTGCTVTNSNGNLACAGTISSGGTVLSQYWQRITGNLSPLNLNDTISATSAASTVLTSTTNNPTGTLTNNTLIQHTGAGTVSNLLTLSRTAGTVTTGLNITGTIGTDINLQNSETITNSPDNTVAVGFGASNGTLQITSATSGNITFSTAGSIQTTSNNNLTLSAGSGTLNLNTVSNGAVTTGTGAITLNGNTTVSTTKTLTLTDINGNNQILYGTPTTGIVAGVGATSTANQCLLSGATTPSWVNCAVGVNQWNQVGGLLYPVNSGWDFAIGGTSTASAQFGIIGVKDSFTYATLAGRLTVADNLKRLSPTPIATISGNTGSVVLSLNNNGRGDLLTASTGGNTKFTVDTNGFIAIGGSQIIPGNSSYITAPNFGVSSAGAINLTTGYGSLGDCLKSGGGSGSANTWGTCGSAGGASWWNQLSGVVYPTSTLYDFALGWNGAGSATTSALFTFLHTNANYSNQPSISIWNSTSQTNGLTLTSSATESTIDATSGTINIGHGGGTLYIQTQIINDAANSPTGANGAVYIADRLNIIPEATSNNVNASLLVNNPGTGDIFTASGGGTTRFTVNNSGAIGLTAGYGVLGQCLTSNGSGTASGWGTCGSGVNWWNQVGGVVYPTSSLYDFAVGGTSTASATFSVTGDMFTFPIGSMAGRFTIADNLKRLSPTPIATISGNTGSVVLSLNNNGRGDLLTASTGGNTKFTLDTNGFIGLGGRRIIPGNTSDITLQNGDTIANTAANTTALSSTTFNLGGGSAATITTATNGLTLDSGSNTLTFAASDTTLTTSLQTFNTAATLAFSGDITITGNDITNTTLSFGNGSAATLNTPSGNAALTIAPNGTGALNLATTNSGAVNIGNTALVTIAGNGSLTLSNAAYATCGVLSTVSNVVTCSSLPGGSINWWNQVNGVVYPTSSLYDFAVGGTSTASATFSVTGNQLSFPIASVAGRLTVADNLKRLSPTPIATISGNTGSVVLSLNNNGRGDLLTASTGGNTKFTLDTNGFIALGGRQIIPGNTSDITLRNGETIDNATDNTLNIGYGAANGIFQITSATSGNLTFSSAGNINSTGTLTLQPTGNIALAPSGTNDVTYNPIAGQQLLITQTTSAPTTDMVSITNAGLGTTTSGVSNLQLTFVGGSAAVESSGERIDLTPGGTSGGTWNALRLVAATGGPASGVIQNLIKIEGPTTNTGTTNGIIIGATNSQLFTTAINIASTGVTTDLSLQNGETLDNNTDNQFNLGFGAAAGTLLLTSTTNSVINASTRLDLQADGSVDVNIAGGSGATGCTVTNTTGALNCSGAISSNGISLSNWWSQVGGLVYPINTGWDFAIGGTSTASAQFGFFGTAPFNTFPFATIAGRLNVADNLKRLSPTPIATISGNTGSVILSLNNNGRGDLLTASASGAPQFTVTNGGSVYGRSFFDYDNSAYFLDPAATGNSLVMNGDALIGGPTSNITGNPQVYISSGGSGIANLALTSVTTDASNKHGSIVLAPFTNANNPTALITGTTTGTASTLRLGGVGVGSSLAAYGVTAIEFYTAANNTTLSGTERMIIDNNGSAGIGTTTPNALLDVDAFQSGSKDAAALELTTRFQQPLISTNSALAKVLMNNVAPSGGAGVTIFSPRGPSSGLFGQYDPSSGSFVGISHVANYDTRIGALFSNWASTSTPVAGSNYIKFDEGNQIMSFFTSGTTADMVINNSWIGIGDTTPDAPLDLEYTKSISTNYGSTAFNFATISGTLSFDNSWKSFNPVNGLFINLTTTSTKTATNSGDISGIRTLVTNNTSNAQQGDYIGGNFLAQMVNTASSAGAFNFNNTITGVRGTADGFSNQRTLNGDLIGVEGYGEAFGDGDVNNVFGGLFWGFGYGDGGRAHIKNVYGVYAAVDTLNGVTALVDNQYGLYIDYGGANHATNSWGLYQADSGSDNYFAGDLGIDITAPTAKLDVADNGAAAGARLINVGDDSFLTDVDAANTLGIYGSTTSTIAILRLGSGGATVQGSAVGDIGIGGAPSFQFDVQESNSSTTDYVARIINTSTGNSTNVLQIRDNASTCGSTVVFIGFFSGGGSNAGNVRCATATSVTYDTTSDQRLKENIKDTHFGINDLMKIQVRDFNFITDPSKEQVTGFIAQELYDIYPTAVYKGGDDPLTNPWEVDYSRLTPILVRAVQDQQGEIASNSGKIAQLASASGSYIDSAGNVNLTDNSLLVDPNFTIPHYFTLNDSLGNPVSAISGFLELAVGNLKAGLVDAQQITTKALSINGVSIHDYIASVVNEVLNGQSYVSPLNTNGGIAIYDQISTSSAVATIDTHGNASFSGSLNVGNEATIGGTLRAKKIIADQIEGLNINASTVSANYITNVTNIYSTDPFPTLPASPSSVDNSNIFAGVLASNKFVNIATLSSQLAYVENLDAVNASIANGLNVYGPSALSDTSIVGQLSINGTFILNNNSINVLGADLNLQPLRQGGLSIMAGLISVDTNGNMTLENNLTVKGTLFANSISPSSGDEVNIGSPSSLLTVKSTGDVIASGAGTFDKLNIGSLVGTALAVSPTEVIATGSAGTASITAGRTEITIDNKLVTDKSLIYITPTTQTYQPLFLLRQVPKTSFTVGIETSDISPIKFNWIIIN